MCLRLWSALILGTAVVLLSLASPARVFADPPPNTTCESATQVILDPWYGEILDVHEAGDWDEEDPHPLCGFDRYYGSVWYRFIAPQKGTLTVGTGALFCSPGPPDSCSDRLLAVFDAVPDGGGQACPVGLDRVIATRCGWWAPSEYLTACLQQGQDVLIMVAIGDGVDVAQQYEIDLWFEPDPTNVSCSAAREIQPQELDPDFQDSVPAYCVPEVWYRFTPPEAGRVSVNTCESDYATEVTVYKGLCAGLEMVAGPTTGGCGPGDPGTALSCINAEAGVPLLVKVTPATPGQGGQLEFRLAFEPGFVLIWETNPDVLLNKLLPFGIPPGIPGGISASVVVDPPPVATDESIGFYQSLNFGDAYTILSAPDGIVLTTGRLKRCPGSHAAGITCANEETNFASVGGNKNGDAQIAALYAAQPPTRDAIGFQLTFASDLTVGGLRFKLILASDAFPEAAAPVPTPADTSQQQGMTQFPDTFGAFLDGRPFAFAKDADGHDVLLNVAPQVITLNNNISGTQNHDITPLTGSFRNVDFNVEYDGFAARQATYPNWGPLQFSVPLHPTGVGEEHTLKFAVADVGPAPGGDATRDTAAFLSELEFIQCNCPPQDADADGDVDLGDFNNAFQPCFNGPNQPYKLDADVCFCMDADHDGDIDVADFLAFQGCFNGPNRPPKCTDGCTRSPDAGMMSASVELSDVVFDLYSPSSGKAIAAGTPVEWSVSVRAAGLDAAVAGCVFDLELRQDSEAGALAKVAIPPPTFATPFSDGSAVWSVSGPSNRPLGTLGGLGDAFPVPWSAESARRLAALSAETAAWLGAASWEPAALPDAGCVVSAGAIDTAGLAPGRYVLVLRPINANVLRRESDLTGALIGNFAAAARAVAGTRSVAFDIAK